MTVMMEIAMLTPPIGLNVFVMQRVTPEVPLSEIFRGWNMAKGIGWKVEGERHKLTGRR